MAGFLQRAQPTRFALPGPTGVLRWLYTLHGVGMVGCYFGVEGAYCKGAAHALKTAARWDMVAAFVAEPRVGADVYVQFFDTVQTQDHAQGNASSFGNAL